MRRQSKGKEGKGEAEVRVGVTEGGEIFSSARITRGKARTEPPKDETFL